MVFTNGNGECRERERERVSEREWVKESEKREKKEQPGLRGLAFFTLGLSFEDEPFFMKRKSEKPPATFLLVEEKKSRNLIFFR